MLRQSYGRGRVVRSSLSPACPGKYPSRLGFSGHKSLKSRGPAKSADLRQQLELQRFFASLSRNPMNYSFGLSNLHRSDQKTLFLDVGLADRFPLCDRPLTRLRASLSRGDGRRAIAGCAP
jgi:hypothetical protein